MENDFQELPENTGFNITSTFFLNNNHNKSNSP